MDTSDFALVRAVAAGGNFSAAARSLGMAHTTVARRLRQLEAYYETRLFDMRAGQMVPTAAGERVIESAERIAQEVTGLERGIKGEDQRLTGAVRLTTVDILAWHFMDRIAAFRQDYPGIELSIETGTEVRSLSRREAEMALRLTNRPDEFLFGRKVGRFDFYPYCREGMAQGEIGALPWIDYSGRDCAGPAGRWLKQTLPDVQPVMSVSTPLIMLRTVAAGTGAGLLPDAVAEAHGGLTRLTDETAFSVDVWLLAPEALRDTARIRAVFGAFG
jgi:DNA-binding transcriptional LysR family regulator